MRKLLWILLLSCCFLGAAPGAEIVPRLSPRRMTAGRPVRYAVELPANPDAEKIRLPSVSGLSWRNHVSTEFRSVNFQSSFRLIFTFTAEKPGNFTIPAWRIRCGGKECRIAACTFTVQQNGKALNASSVGGSAGNEAISGEIRLTVPRRKFFVGEEIPVEIRVELPVSSGSRVAYPKLAASASVIYHDFSAVNPRFPSFDQPVSSNFTRGGERFQKIVFATAFRAVRPGALALTGEINLQLPVRRENAFDDDEDLFNHPMVRNFLNGGMRYEPYTLKLAPLKNLEILPLPLPPAQTVDTGLVGDWDGFCRADVSTLKVGDALTLTLVLTGHGSTDLWRASPLSVPGFRDYPPEVQKSVLPDGSQKVVVRYALIALQEGPLKREVVFSFFDPAKGAYRTVPCRFDVRVTPGERLQTAAVQKSSVLPSPMPEKKTVKASPAPALEAFSYQKPSIGEEVELPFFRNVRKRVAALLGIGFAVAAGALLWRRRHALRAGVCRRKNAFIGRRRLLQALSQTKKDPEKFAEALLALGLPALLEARGLPPGTTLEEAVRTIPDAELQKILLAAGENGFCPGGQQHRLSAEEMKKVTAFFKKLLLVLGCSALFTLHGAEESLNAAYDRGDYAAAVKHYTALLKKEAPSPALLCNLGNAYCQTGNLPMARYALLKAHLLAPRDAEIRTNLEWVDRRLRTGEADEPATLLRWLETLRDRMRPDEYLLGAALFLALAMVLAALPLAKAVRLWGAGTALLLALLLAGLLYAQMRGPYAPQRAVVTAEKLELRSLPVSNGGRVTALLPGGMDVRVEETRGDWVRLRSGTGSGWAPKTNATRLFPQGLW